MPRWTPMTPEERFWGHVEETGDCQLWTGALDRDGYGRYNLPDQGRRSAHALRWELAHGPLADGQVVCHACDVRYPAGDLTYRRCVRLEHLFVGTQSENIADRHAKGRDQRGERHYLAKLTTAQVEELKQRYAAGGISTRELGYAYGMTNGAVSNIINGKTRRHG